MFLILTILPSLARLVLVKAADCEVYDNNIFCQAGATNCITCKAGGDDNAGVPCDGVRLKLFSSEDDFCGWCPDTCVPFIKEGDRCWLDASGIQLHGMCGPHLTCRKAVGQQQASCVRTDTHCLRALKKYEEALVDGKVGMDQTPPVCDPEGFWSPVQCSGADVCRCVDKNTGVPIFGLELNMTVAKSEMTCGCAREVEELREMSCNMKVKYDGPEKDSIKRYEEQYKTCMTTKQEYFPGHLRCMPNGNYDPAQCIAQTTDLPNHPAYAMEECFCYYEGQQFNSSIAPINIAHITLECHQVDEDTGHFAGFYRPCEKKVVEHRKLVEDYKAAGAHYISTEWFAECGVDGFYAKVQRKKENTTEGYCADKYGNPLSDYHGVEYHGVYKDMDCECAMVRHGTSQWGEKPSCTSDGSYRNFQCKGGKCYCVDRYGFQCDMEAEQTVTLDCTTAEDQNVEHKAPATCTIDDQMI